MKPPVFSCLASRTTNNGSLYGRFLFGPLPVDISLTVATILRRSLLHRKAPFTIVSAEIEGAIHEYAALPGIQESVLEILLNLGEVVLTGKRSNLDNALFKSAPLQSHQFKSQTYTASLRISGPCLVTAKDIHWPDGILCVKPQAHIATLSGNNTLAIRIKIIAAGTKNSTSYDQSRFGAYSFQQPSLVSSIKDNLSKGPKSTLKNRANNPIVDANSNTQSVGQTLKTDKLASQIGGAVGKGRLPFPQEKQKGTPFLSVLRSLSFGSSGRVDSKPLSSRLILGGQENPKGTKELSTPLGKNNDRRVFFYNPKKSLQSKCQFNFQSSPTLVNPQIFQKFISTPLYSLNGGARQVRSPYYFRMSGTQGGAGLLNSRCKRNKASGFNQLAVSSSFYPIEKVNFVIERDDQLVGYRHRIIFEIWTNGSISPRQAIFDSISWIIKLLYNFRERSTPFEIAS